MTGFQILSMNGMCQDRSLIDLRKSIWTSVCR